MRCCQQQKGHCTPHLSNDDCSWHHQYLTTNFHIPKSPAGPAADCAAHAAAVAVAQPPPRAGVHSPQLRASDDIVPGCAQDLLLIAKRTLLPSPSRSRLRALVRRSRSLAARPRGGDQAADTPTLLRAKKPIVLVLGSGWAAHALIKVRARVCSQ